MILLLSIWIVFFITLALVSKKDSRKIMVAFVFIIALISFFIKPTYKMDLYRHYETLDLFRQGGWTSVINHRYFTSLPIFSIYFYIVSRLSNNGFLPMITIFIEYILVFFMILKCSKKFDTTKTSILYASIFFISTFNYFGAVSGIRNMLAFSIFAYFLYIDLVENKKKLICFSIYIILCMFHTSVIILLVFRIVLFVRNKIFITIIGVGLFMSSLYMPIVLKVLNKFQNFEIMKLFSLQIESYMYQSYKEPISHIHSTIILSFIILIFICFATKTRNKYKELEKINIFTSLIICLTVGSYNNFNMYSRFVSFLIIVSSIYIVLYFGIRTKKDNYRNVLSINKKYNYKISNIVFFLMIQVIFISNFYLFYFQYRYIYLI